MSSPATTPRAAASETFVSLVPVLGLAFVLAVVSQFIGTQSIKVGPASITFLPMIWGVLLGVLFSAQKIRPISVNLQTAIASIMGIGVLFLVARIAFNIGPSIPLLAKAGPALILQEIGHLTGTILLALPTAYFLRMGRATVGATFSIDREPAFAMATDRFGADSEEYKGVLSMYVFGALFGALWISVLASFVVSLNIFNPLALAMGSGVGSASMMGAAAAVIGGVHPELKDQISALAAVSNLITSILGVYVGMYIALPLAQKFYNFLDRGKDPSISLAELKKAGKLEEPVAAVAESAEAAPAQLKVPVWASVLLVLAGTIVTCSIAIFTKGPVKPGTPAPSYVDAALGLAVIAALVFGSMLLGKLTPKITPMIWVMTLGAFISSQWSPVSGVLVPLFKSVDLVAIITVVLVLAGLSMGKDLGTLKKIGWRIIPVGLVAVTAVFMLATTVANFVLSFIG